VYVSEASYVHMPNFKLLVHVIVVIVFLFVVFFLNAPCHRNDKPLYEKGSKLSRESFCMNVCLSECIYPVVAPKILVEK